MVKLPVFISTLVCALTFLLPTKGSAEIVNVVINWIPAQCTQNCPIAVKQNMEKIPQVYAVDVDQTQGTCVLWWRAYQPYNYQMIQFPLARVGVGIEAMGATVRGTIVSQGSTTYLESIGDKTRFVLLGPAVPDPVRMTNVGSSSSYPLGADTKARLIRAQANGEVVAVTGTFFLEYRTPLSLIADKITYARQN